MRVLLRGVLFFVVVLSTCGLIKAQTYHYVPMVGNDTLQWDGLCYHHTPGNNYAIGASITMAGDTIFNGIQYKELVNGQAWFGALTETPQKKVYYNCSNGNSLGILLYDFSVSLNDTVSCASISIPCYFGASYRVACVVTNIDTILLDGTLRKRFKLRRIDSGGLQDIWIEGLGSALMGGCLDFTCYNGIGTSLCSFYKNGVKIFDAGNSACAPTEVQDLSDRQFDIESYPNPVGDICNVDIIAGRSKLEVNLYALTGQMLCHQTYTESKFKIDMTNLSAGVYFLQITDEKENKVIKKVVKE